METEKMEEQTVETVVPSQHKQVFNEEFLSITSTVVIVFTFAIINVLSYMV
jgi:hypothetical protein